jgi:hypothetical protein
MVKIEYKFRNREDLHMSFVRNAPTATLTNCVEAEVELGNEQNL